MKNHGFHGNQSFSRKEVNFTENVTAVKSRIKLVPTYYSSHPFVTSKSHCQ